ncbi:hypothetical protein OG453_07580 [Streptomyces sp. NBC_01381]|uniref:hypothetical protein n=1 Tax=Streptomyces sp. NBC_01381 TaxID=2903845 RepID=UPI0022550A65|nr:hypothetical protein [Streptomyces sp. NBC_01381]MCX4666530.1 hypothetical protein [Streptomyces sp. NBC_01381]
MDDAQAARVRQHTAGWEHRAGLLVGVFVMGRDDVLPFLGDIVACEDKTSYYASYTVSQDAIEITVGGSGDSSITDTEYLLALRISAAAAVRGVRLLGS